MRRFAMGDVSVADMAAAREARAMRQQRLLMQRGALVCLTMNIPGPHKTSPLIAVAFEEGKRLIAQALPAASLAHELRDKTGFEAYYQAADDPLTVKRALCTVEDTTPLGRLPRSYQIWTPRPFWPTLASSWHQSWTSAAGCARAIALRALARPPF